MSSGPKSYGKDQDQLTIKTKAWAFEAKAIGWGSEAKAFKNTTIVEVKICSTSDSLTGQVTTKCCLHLLRYLSIINYK